MDLQQLRASAARLHPGDGLLSFVALNALDPLLRAALKVACAESGLLMDSMADQVGVIATRFGSHSDSVCLEFDDGLVQIRAGSEHIDISVDPDTDTGFLRSLCGIPAILWINISEKLSIRPLANSSLAPFAQVMLGEKVQQMVESVLAAMKTKEFITVRIGPFEPDGETLFELMQVGKTYSVAVDEMKQFISMGYFPQGSIFFVKRTLEKIDVLMVDGNKYSKPSVFDILHLVDIHRITTLARARHEKVPAV